MSRRDSATIRCPSSPRLARWCGRTLLEPSHIRPVSRRPPAPTCILSQFCAIKSGSTRTLRPAMLPLGHALMPRRCRLGRGTHSRSRAPKIRYSRLNVRLLSTTVCRCCGRASVSRSEQARARIGIPLPERAHSNQLGCRSRRFSLGLPLGAVTKTVAPCGRLLPMDRLR